MTALAVLGLVVFLASGATGRSASAVGKAPYDIDSPADVERAIATTFAPRRPPMELPPIEAAWKDIVADVTKPPVKIIFDTDIGTDIDDAITLCFALRRPELEVCAITTSRGEVGQRAAIVSRLLQQLGREDIPFAPGAPRRADGSGMKDKPVDQFPYAGPAADRPRAACAEAQELFRRTISAHPGEIWLVVAGPMTNAAILIRDHPDVARQLRGIVCMGGEPTRATAETNFKNDPAAAAIVCASGLLKFAATDDVCMRLLMPKPDIDRLRRTDTPVGRALVTLYDLYRLSQNTKPAPVAFDLCPVAWLIAPELFVTKTQGWQVNAEGMTKPSSTAPALAASTDLKAVALHRLLMETITR